MQVDRKCQLDGGWVGNLKRGEGKGCRVMSWNAQLHREMRKSGWLPLLFAVMAVLFGMFPPSLPFLSSLHFPTQMSLPPFYINPKPIHIHHQQQQRHSTYLFSAHIHIYLFSHLWNCSASQTPLFPIPNRRHGHSSSPSLSVIFIGILGGSGSCFCKFLQWFRHHMGQWSC